MPVKGARDIFQSTPRYPDSRGVDWKMSLAPFIAIFLFFSVAQAQVPESPKLNCEYSALRMANFGKNSLRDEAAMVLNNTVRMLGEHGKKEHEICISPIYVRARRLYDRIATELAKAAEQQVKVKYSSKESSL